MGSIEVFDEFVRTELLKLMKDSKVQYHSRLAQVAADAVLEPRPAAAPRKASYVRYAPRDVCSWVPADEG